MSDGAKRTRVVNDIGIGLRGADGERLVDVRVYVENGTVELWVEVEKNPGGPVIEALQYLTPTEAMAFAKAFERCAIQALKEGAT